MAPPLPPACLSHSPSTPTTPQTNTPFSPSTITTSSAQTPPPSRGRSSVPFSWEAKPGVPKHDPTNDTATTGTAARTATPLRPPPSTLRTNSDPFPTLRRRGSSRSPRTGAGPANTLNDPVFVRDPFAVALAECCSVDRHHLDDYTIDSGAASRGGSRRWAPEYYYCSPSVTNGGGGGSRRWAADLYYCSPPTSTTKGAGTGTVGRHLLSSVFGLRSLGLYASCKSASAVADSIAYLPARRAAAARVRSAAGSPTAAAVARSPAVLSRSESMRRWRAR